MKPKSKKGSQITPTATEILCTPAAHEGISQTELLENVVRLLDEPEVESKRVLRSASVNLSSNRWLQSHGDGVNTLRSFN
ncbi:hypothetical protein H6G81_23565 [Scytonema hofmannii FACHB-248]|uniref:Transposase n=1 Tax=Scytonema hofmannii FACHB-248 TaxID=1842502 RepID=A0ABR8GW93_9CYAN|nr:hypothetical protein [[Scytonema hofmanni] UTEX B 1581]MBD2607422.1 hypothetical protein [Scytonema hofmannii FACHB-248]